MQSGQLVEKNNKQQTVVNDDVHLEFKVGQLRFCASVLEVEAIVSPPKMNHCQRHQPRHVFLNCILMRNQSQTYMQLPVLNLCRISRKVSLCQVLRHLLISL